MGYFLPTIRQRLRQRFRQMVANTNHTQSTPAVCVDNCAQQYICTLFYPGVLCNKGYPSETHLKPVCREISFVHNIHLNNPIVLQFCIECGSTIVCRVLYKISKRLQQMLWINEISRDLTIRSMWWGVYFPHRNKCILWYQSHSISYDCLVLKYSIM